VILLLVLLDPSDYRSCPLDNQVLQAIPLIEICIHELLHGLTWQPALFALLIELSLLLVDVIDKVAQLAQSEHSLRGPTHGGGHTRDAPLVEKLATGRFASAETPTTCV